jgi:hypothetical protein
MRGLVVTAVQSGSRDRTTLFFLIAIANFNANFKANLDRRKSLTCLFGTTACAIFSISPIAAATIAPFHQCQINNATADCGEQAKGKDD